ncbi:general substrate transporter [Umbelopsis sp. AD052]|nr:general substrate transporter [Umbelopsis sp. AD052]
MPGSSESLKSSDIILNASKNKGWRKSVYIAATLAAVGGFVCGYDTGAVAGILYMPTFRDSFPELASDDQFVYLEGLLVAFMLMTAALGAFASGPICDYIGRKRAIILGSYVFSLGILFEIIGFKFGLLLTGRLVAGFGNGLMTNAVPLYHSEIAPPDIRGRLVSLFTVMSSFGQVVGYFVTFGTSYLTTSWGWRAPWLIQLIVCVVLGTAVLFLPFSPRWLIDIGREDEGLAVIAELQEASIDDPTVRAEFDEIKTELDAEKAMGKRTYSELFHRGNRKRTFIAFFIAIATSFTGIDAILYYGPAIFADAGLSDVSSAIAASGGTGIVSLFATIVSLIFIDKWGRKFLFILGAVVMGISMFITGAMFQVYAYIDDTTGEIVMTNVYASNTIMAFIFIFMAAFSLTWGVASYVYPAEIFNMRCRAKGLGLTYGLNWAFSILVTYCMPLFMASTLSGAYFFFGACCAVMTVVIFFIPETRNRTLESMEEIFHA